MRTTITIDEDVAAILERLRSTRRRSLNALVNEALRAGLHVMAKNKGKRPRRFKTTSQDLGRSLVGNVDNVAEVLAVAEGDSYR